MIWSAKYSPIGFCRLEGYDPFFATEEGIVEKLIKPIPAVNAAIFDTRGRVLLTRRSATVREPGKWCLPGGHFDGGEDWIKAVRREIMEEIGLEILDQELYGIYSDPEVTVSETPTKEGWYGQYLVACFIVREFRGEISPNSEVDEWDFFDVNDLPSPILKSHPVRIRDAAGFHGKVFVR
jgi:8-oxo-dGTP pyrophosphatase MutT (NUDIX family)